MTEIDIKNLKVKAGGRNIVDIEQIHFRSPYTYGILGPNGSGKSTLLKAICGILNNYEGSIRMNGHEIRQEHNEIAKITGSLIENPSFYPYSTPAEFVRYTWEMRTGMKIKDDFGIDEIMDMVNMRGKMDSMMRTFSTGELKRTGVAGAIAGNPECILLDEPTDNVDLIGRDLIAGSVNSIRAEGNKLLIIASHDVSFLEKVCDTVIFLKDGKVQKTVKISETQLTNIIIEDTPMMNGLENQLNMISISGVKVTVSGDINPFLNYASANNIRIREIIKINVLDEEYRKIFSDQS
ncbi:MAG: ABC transporter ATP-binding protein [Candidatus Thermoplasmatota archaeon]|nr:ABC transporter ATP-binding protein [Candidatus Thermoplasmatota archaeon]MCL5790613.1 ABC transporter ATP-binding protein [Candidatus Thermoplasmatota archaeon]